MDRGNLVAPPHYHGPVTGHTGSWHVRLNAVHFWKDPWYKAKFKMVERKEPRRTSYDPRSSGERARCAESS